MCRHLAYLGPPTALGALLIDPPHGLVAQARAPRWQVNGTENPDGYGVAWWGADDEAPRRYRSPTRIWEDPDLAALAPHAATAVVAAARLASPGSPVDVSGNAPFLAGPYAWSLNGVVDGWHEGVGAELRPLISPRRAAGMDGVTDGEALFALALDALDAGVLLDDAVANVIATVEARTTGRLNIVVSDGRRVVATARGNSLFARHGDGSCLLASEPFAEDDDAWTRVADGELLTATAAGASAATRL